MNKHLSTIYFLFTFLSTTVFSQNPVQYLYLDEHQYEYFDYLINSGKSIPKFVFSQPFEKNDSLFYSVKKKTAEYFNNYHNDYFGNKKLNGQLLINDKISIKNTIFNRYKLAGSLHYSDENITLANRTVVDQEYKLDPLFAGDLSESKSWLYGRVNDAYINLRFNRLNLFFGRMHRNWGPVNSKSLILSNNPYTC